MANNTCGTVIGGPVILSVSGTITDFEGNPTGTMSNVKFETEGSVSISPKNFNFEDRGEGRGHTKVRRNSYVEGTVTLDAGIFSSSDDTINGSITAENIREAQDMFCLCGATVQLETVCGDIYTMTNAVFTGEGSIDLREGTASFRFSSPFAMKKSARGTTNAANNAPDGPIGSALGGT